MRELTLKEIGCVAGGHCEGSDDGGGGESAADQQSQYSSSLTVIDLDNPPIALYERVVDRTSRLIEKAADAIKGD